MNDLLDSCAIIWTVAEPERLSAESLQALKEADTDVSWHKVLELLRVNRLLDPRSEL